MTNETEGSDVGLEVPYHDGAVEGAANHLLQVRVKAGRNHALFVALE